jgi:predicted nucleic acid-binding protein
MTVIVDASVALKWVIEEEGSQAARTLLLDEPLAAPDLLIVEAQMSSGRKLAARSSRAISPVQRWRQSKPPPSSYCLPPPTFPPPRR